MEGWRGSRCHKRTGKKKKRRTGGGGREGRGSLLKGGKDSRLMLKRGRNLQKSSSKRWRPEKGRKKRKSKKERKGRNRRKGGSKRGGSEKGRMRSRENLTLLSEEANLPNGCDFSVK